MTNLTIEEKKIILDSLTTRATWLQSRIDDILDTNAVGHVTPKDFDNFDDYCKQYIDGNALFQKVVNMESSLEAQKQGWTKIADVDA
jgi:hypothetical protein